jgi:hypothetical protein
MVIDEGVPGTRLSELASDSDADPADKNMVRGLCTLERRLPTSRR